MATHNEPRRHTTRAGAPVANEQRLDRGDARYLLTRAGFTPSESKPDAYAELMHREAIDRVLAQTGTTATQTPPAWVSEPIIPYDKLPDEDACEATRQKNTAHKLKLQTWWMGKMIRTPSPLTGRMMLFWHNHSAFSSQEVPSA